MLRFRPSHAFIKLSALSFSVDVYCGVGDQRAQQVARDYLQLRLRTPVLFNLRTLSVAGGRPRGFFSVTMGGGDSASDILNR